MKPRSSHIGKQLSSTMRIEELQALKNPAKKYQQNIQTQNKKDGILSFQMGSSPPSSGSKCSGSSGSKGSSGSTSQGSSSSSYTCSELASLPQKMKKILAGSEQIKAIKLLKSPVQNSGITLLNPLVQDTTHHEVLVIFYYFCVLIGLYNKGVEFNLGFDEQELIRMRSGNQVQKEYTQSFSKANLEGFLKSNVGKPYDLMSWNCQHFAKNLIEEARKK